jgi:hypothetical protein
VAQRHRLRALRARLSPVSQGAKPCPCGFSGDVTLVILVLFLMWARMRRAGRSAMLAGLLTLLSAPAAAQSSPILPSTRVLQAGPLSFYPTIALRDAGVDSNVFNDATGPKGDFTYSIVPRLYVVMPVGNTRFVGTGFGNLAYYQTYKDQQSISGLFEGRYEVMGPGFRPFATAGFADRRERRGFEIDARVRQRQTTMSIGADTDITGRTALTAWFGRTTTAWDRDAQYLGTFLAEQLDYSTNSFAAGARFRATPFTTLSLTAEVERDRFDRAPLRDADKLFIGPSADFAAGAAIVGHVKAGYQTFTPLSPMVNSYSGLAANASVRYELLDMTEVKLDARRDVDYSYDPIQPYYLESGGIVTVSQRVLGPLEAIAIGERRVLRLQRLGESSFDGRHEVTRTFGGGLALDVGKQMRFELIYERRTRTSSEPAGREYERRRLYASAIYGL